MDLQQKTETGLFPPPGFSSTYKANLDDNSVSELVSILRTAFRFDEFDSVEKVLVARDASLKAEIASLQVKIELERLNKIRAEEELKKKEEQCQKGERALELYEKLLKRVKESEFGNMKTVEESSDKNCELLAENCKFGEDDKIAMDGLRMRNNEMEEELKNDKGVIDELKTVNTRLLDENQRLKALVESKERKYLELNEKVLKIEDDVKLLKSANAAYGSGSGEWKGPMAEPQELEEFNEMKGHGCNTGSIPFQGNRGTCKVNKDAPGTGGSGSVPNTTIIEIADSDDEDNDDQSHRRQQKNFSSMETIERVARKISLSDISSSSSDSPSHCYKKRKRG
ncbi:hypothetical protein TanjilG_00814 [Lupinus angustifolius]|uniref:Uncharacterized protein n=1 Tax=Lupinus angustifolius TaxID=3871 RepID=A0A4P1R7Y3_LUPAN|nr:PREDICTED: uncharacterized protein LOC109355973 [Lupinus angustifolius]OIW04254.1 hypothetical protein TanjilG_00814 [Lupinus angustifolius]